MAGQEVSADTHCHHLIQYMWWAAQKIEQGTNPKEDYRTSIVLFADPRPSHVRYRDTAIADSIGTTAQPNQLQATGGGATSSDPAIAGPIIGLKESLGSVMLRSEAGEAEGSKQFARLPDHLKPLLYRLSHILGEDEPKALSTNGKHFMAQPTLASATSLLKTTLRNTYGLSVMVQGASIQALHTGLLLWDDPVTPGNHSVFQYYSPTPGDSTDAAADLSWHLTSTEGQGIDGEEIKKAMKLKPRVAQLTFGSSRQILNFASLQHGFLFGDGCLIYINLKAFTDWMLSPAAMATLERLSTKHPRFYERLLATLDIRIQEYITSCSDAATVDEIESSLILFEGLKQSLRVQNASELVGPVFPDAQQAGVGKRKAQDSMGKSAAPAKSGRSETNKAPHPSLALKTFSEWDKVRRFTDCVPKLEGINVCARFHCRQVCNSNCEHAHAHLSPPLVKEMEKWVKESKAKSAAATNE
jgi:hypothetical protein